MRIGNVVKWTRRGASYGHMGIVTEVFSNGNYRVYWAIDNERINHDNRSNYVEVLCE
jgi:hypothetical protein